MKEHLIDLINSWNNQCCTFNCLNIFINFGRNHFEDIQELIGKFNQNNYECKTSTWYGIGGMYATVLYDYRVYVSLPTGGMVIKPSIYIAYPHKADEDPKFKLCDDFHIVMDCVYSKEEALSFTTGLDDKIIKQIMNKSIMKKALDILSLVLIPLIRRGKAIFSITVMCGKSAKL